MSYVFLISELWRKESSMQHSLSSLKEELTKSDQILRSMAGKVIYILYKIKHYIINIIQLQFLGYFKWKR